MKIQTSYFASKAPADRKVCIAKKLPRYLKVPQIRELAPSNPWADNWQERYKRDLQDRFPNGEGLLELLQKIHAMKADPILCCYEKDPGQCHRSILAAYIREHLNLEINEWSQADGG